MANTNESVRCIVESHKVRITPRAAGGGGYVGNRHGDALDDGSAKDSVLTADENIFDGSVVQFVHFHRIRVPRYQVSKGPEHQLNFSHSFAEECWLRGHPHLLRNVPVADVEQQSAFRQLNGIAISAIQQHVDSTIVTGNGGQPYENTYRVLTVHRHYITGEHLYSRTTLHPLLQRRAAIPLLSHRAGAGTNSKNGPVNGIRSHLVAATPFTPLAHLTLATGPAELVVVIHLSPHIPGLAHTQGPIVNANIMHLAAHAVETTGAGGTHKQWLSTRSDHA